MVNADAALWAGRLQLDASTHDSLTAAINRSVARDQAADCSRSRAVAHARATISSEAALEAALIEDAELAWGRMDGCHPDEREDA